MLAIPWRRLILATYTLLGKTWLLLLSCVTVCVVTLLPCVLYNIVYKVERLVLTN